MYIRWYGFQHFIGLAFTVIASTAHAESNNNSLFNVWHLPEATHPADNIPTQDKIALGKKLFFDPNLSRSKNMSCASCHAPHQGWSDGLGFSVGFNKQRLTRGSPTIINTAYSDILMWDGRFPDLESQALGPISDPAEMNMPLPEVLTYLREDAVYPELFRKAFPNEVVNETTLGKAIAAYERTIVLKDTPFDRWLRGEKHALTANQVKGFNLFIDPNKANCASCHHPPAFTDNGFHNIGLPSYAEPNPDMGRYKQVPISLMKGAFKTPQLRGLAMTAPYFHDGSAKSLAEVVDHYIAGGIVKSNLSPSMKPLQLTPQERLDLIAFLESLSPKPDQLTLKANTP